MCLGIAETLENPIKFHWRIEVVPSFRKVRPHPSKSLHNQSIGRSLLMWSIPHEKFGLEDHVQVVAVAST